MADPIPVDKLLSESNAVVLGGTGQLVKSLPAQTTGADQSDFVSEWQVYEFHVRKVLHGVVDGDKGTILVARFVQRPANGVADPKDTNAAISSDANYVLVLGEPVPNSSALRILYGSLGTIPVTGDSAAKDLSTLDDTAVASLTIAPEPGIQGVAPDQTGNIALDKFMSAAGVEIQVGG